MEGSCDIKLGFFNKSLHTTDLAYMVAKVYRDVKRLNAIDKKKDFSTEDFYAELLAQLKSENTPYQVEYSQDWTRTQKEAYKTALIELKDTILRSIPEACWKDIKRTKLQQLLDENLPQDLHAGKLRNLNVVTDETFVIERVEVDEESDVPKEVSLRQFLDDKYGTCFSAMKQLKNEFTRNIFTYSIVDFKKGRYITTSAQLNENIASYKQELFGAIVEFLRSKNPSTVYSDSMYTPNNNVSSAYYSVMEEMGKYINDIDASNVINTHFATRLSGTEVPELTAINAYTTLKYFDSLLEDALGKTISYNKSYKNLEQGLAWAKYSFNKDTEHQRKNWSDSENRTAAQNTARFSKIVLESIPLKVNGKLLDRNVGIMLFNVTITKLFANMYELRNSKDPNVKVLIQLIREFHNSPIYNAYKLFKLISEDTPEGRVVRSTLRLNLKFNDLDFGTISSVYEYLLAYDNDLPQIRAWDKVARKSIRAIEFNTLKTDPNLGKYSILNDIIGVMDDCMDATYYYTKYNYNGTVETIKRVKYKNRRGSERFINNLNASTFTYSQEWRKHLKDTCKVNFEKGGTLIASVHIPLTGINGHTAIDFTLKTKNTFGILAQTDQIDLLAAGNTDTISRVFELFGYDSPIDISNNTVRQRLLGDSNQLTDDEKLFKATLKFIDDRLRTKFLSEDGLQKLNIYKGLTETNDKPYILDLLMYSAKAQIVSDLYFQFEEVRKLANEYKSPKDFNRFVRARYKAFANLGAELKKTYFSTYDGVDKLLAIAGSPKWVALYDYATLVLQGDASSSVSKNLSRNNDANYVTAYLGGQIHNVTYNAMDAASARERTNKLVRASLTQIIEDKELSGDPEWLAMTEELKELFKRDYMKEHGVPQTAASALLFTQNPLLVQLAVINSDVMNREGTVKNIRDLKQSELFYNAIVHNFWISYINNKSYAIQPTTYSDKVKLIHYLVDAESKGILVKRYISFDAYYKNLVGDTNAEISAEDVQKMMELYELEKANGTLKKVTQAVALSDLTPDEIIHLYAKTIGESSRLAEQNVIHAFKLIWKQELTLDLINARLKGYVSDEHTSAEDKLIDEATKAGVLLQLDFHYRVKKAGGKEFLSINETIPYQARYANETTLRKKLEQEKINFVNSLVDSGVQFYTEYLDTSLGDNKFARLTIKEQLQKSNSPVAKIILNEYKTNAELYDYVGKWVQGGKLIFGYNSNGEAITYKNTEDVAELNPLLEKFFYLDSLLANNLRFQLTGFETNHPDKSKFLKMWAEEVRGINNELIRNTTIPNKKGKILAEHNIERLLKAQIIWGHSALGKTTYLLNGGVEFLDFDDYFNPARNELIAKVMGDASLDAKTQFLIEALNYIVQNGGTYNNELIPAYEEFRNLLLEKWELIKADAKALKKKVLASTTITLLLPETKKDFDLFLTLSDDEFARRKGDGPEVTAWKASINEALSEHSDKTVDVGDLYMSDIAALSNGIDLYALSKSGNSDLRRVANNLTEVVLNISQGTQLKRNVIVPATMHYMHGDFINGVARNIKVAIIQDIPAKVFNFDGLGGSIDSMDGAAFINAFESILENKTLGSQEVGADKKPIWHHYDQNSGTAALMKFATFEINNARMRASKGSEVPLYRMFKKMTNMLWSHVEDGNLVWDTSSPIRLGRTTSLTGLARRDTSLNFASDILENKPLYYRSYGADGSVTYKQIYNFGYDEEAQAYYTMEAEVDVDGTRTFNDTFDDEGERVYHYYNADSEHHTIKLEGDHSINSLFELWEAMGGMESLSLGDDFKLLDSESSNYVVVNFMNLTVTPKSGADTDRMDITLNSYNQPLKDMMIGYLTNNSAMKNGAANRNSKLKWFNNEQLHYMTMDSRNLGIQMDADHDVEEGAEMTEFSQVIAALEAGGALHKYSKQVYKDLGKVAAIASQIELDTLATYLAGEETNYEEVKSLLYDLVGRTLLNGIKSREDLASLTDSILKKIEKLFNKNIDHLSDAIKIPLSDPNIYSQIIPTIVSIINRKSIKRKYVGSGCVMIPGFNVMLYYLINGVRHMFTDLIPEAAAWMQALGMTIPETVSDKNRDKYMVDLYLAAMQEDESLIKPTVRGFMPTDLVDVVFLDGTTKFINLDGLDEYYMFTDWDKARELIIKSQTDSLEKEETAFLEKFLKTLGVTAEQVLLTKHFRTHITSAKNLAPVRVTFLLEDGTTMNVFDLDVFRNAYNERTNANTKDVQKAFRMLKLESKVVINGEEHTVSNILNMPAELIISDMYSKIFGTGGKSIALIRKEGPAAFRKTYQAPAPSTNYDVRFDGSDPTYVTFTNPKHKPGNTYVPYKKSNLYTEKDSRGNINVYLISDDNRKLFKVGRYILRSKYSYREGKYFDEEEKEIPSKQTTNFKREGSVVYEYVEFISKYKVNERKTASDGGTERTNEYEKYYINLHNLDMVFGRDNDDDSDKVFKSFVTGLLDDIYATKQFEGMTFNLELTQRSAGAIVTYVANMNNVDAEFKTKVIAPIEKHIRAKLKELSAFNTNINSQIEPLTKHLKELRAEEGRRKQLNQEFTPEEASANSKTKREIFTLWNRLKALKASQRVQLDVVVDELYNAYYDALAEYKYHSWEQSLYFTAARIPAQTLQSFMLMEAVAYTGNTSNLVFVSHWQAWLLGSDYDIDKSYIMGQEFGVDGKLIKWSNLFSYNSLKELQASTWLPTPRKLRINHTGNIQEGLEDLGTEVDISDEVRKLARVYYDDPAERIKQEAELIIKIYDSLSDDDKKVYLTYDPFLAPDEEIIARLVIRDIISHERTVISPNLEEAAYKNSVSANIKNIVQDLENMTMAYLPIAMDDLQDLAANSEKGAMTAHMSLMNPLTKYIMLVQNMVGKKVIGITAVAEKVFFNLSYYYNEGLRSGDVKWRRNMQFHLTFDRILGRYNLSKGNGTVESITKTTLANINFTGYEALKSRFVKQALVDKLVRKELGITDTDIVNQNDNYVKYINRLAEIQNNPKVAELYYDTIFEASPVDLFISQILSAATDNAKELILSKINAGDNLAKCHLYLLMLGFDIKDVVTFMTTPYANLVNALSESNMMDNYMSNVSVKDAIKLSRGIIDVSKFLVGVREIGSPEEGYAVRTREELVMANLKNSLLYTDVLADAKMRNPNVRSINSLSKLIQGYVLRRLAGTTTKRLAEFVTIYDYETRKLVNALSDYVDKLVYLISKARDKYTEKEGSAEGFDLDADEFEKVLKLADETSTLGSTLLKLNQGLPSSKEDMLESIRKITKAFSDREAEFDIKLNIFAEPSKGVLNPEKAAKDKWKRYYKLVGLIVDNNRFLGELTENPDGTLSVHAPEVEEILRRAYAFGLVDNFNFEDWINDRLLTKEDLVNKKMITEDLSNIIGENEVISYRDLVSDYYNLIKGTWNIFDVINKVPQYKSILKLYSFVYNVDKNSSVRSHLTNVIYDKVITKMHYIEPRLVKAIEGYINDLLIASYFKENNVSFPIYAGMEYLDSRYITLDAKHNMLIDLNTAPGRAAFKKVFEGIIPALQDTGMYGGELVIENPKDNKLLQDLGIYYEKDGTPRLSLELDMMKLDATPHSQRVFLQYLNGLDLLKHCYINGVAISDWLILYNLFTNLNQYGSDRLTTIFRNSIIGDDSILSEYFSYLGSLDYHQQSEDFLKTLDFNMDDLWIRMAPTVSTIAESFATAPYIKVRKRNGDIILKKQVRSGVYRKENLFPDNEMLDAELLDELKNNYAIYLMLKMKNQDFNLSLRLGLQSNDFNTFLDTLRIYVKRGLLRIDKENC